MSSDDSIQLIHLRGKTYTIRWPRSVNRWDEHFDQILGMWEDGETSTGDAERMLLAILKKSPEFIDVYNSVGAICWRDGNIDKALEYFEEGWKLCHFLLPGDFSGKLPWRLEDNRPFLRLMHNIALGYLYRGEEKEARRLLERQIALNPTDDQGAAMLIDDIEKKRLAFTSRQRISQILNVPEAELGPILPAIAELEKDFQDKSEDQPPSGFEFEADKIDAPYFAGLLFYYATGVPEVPEEWLLSLALHAAQSCRPLEGGGIPAYIFSIYAYLIEREKFDDLDLYNLRDLLYIRAPGDSWIANPLDATILARHLMDPGVYDEYERDRLVFLLLAYEEVSREASVLILHDFFSNAIQQGDNALEIIRDILASTLPGPLGNEDFWEIHDRYQQSLYEQDYWELDDHFHPMEWSGWEGFYADDGEEFFPEYYIPDLEDLFERLSAEDDFSHEPARLEYFPLSRDESLYELPDDDWTGYRRIRTPHLPPRIRRFAIRALAALTGIETTIRRYRKVETLPDFNFPEIRHGVLDLIEEFEGELDQTFVRESLAGMAFDTAGHVRLRARALAVERGYSLSNAKTRPIRRFRRRPTSM